MHTIAIPAVHHRSRLSNFMADHLRMIVERDLLHTLSPRMIVAYRSCSFQQLV
jgi:hypothetical protein